MGALGEQEVGTGGPLAEEHQHGTLAGVRALGRDEQADVAGLDRVRPLADRLQPLGQRQAFAEKYAGKVDVVGIDFQETRVKAARKLARDKGVDYPLYADPDGQMRARFMPKVILLAKDGTIAHEMYVEIKSVPQLEKLVRTHLGVTG